MNSKALLESIVNIKHQPAIDDKMSPLGNYDSMYLLIHLWLDNASSSMELTSKLMVVAWAHHHKLFSNESQSEFAHNCNDKMNTFFKGSYASKYYERMDEYELKQLVEKDREELKKLVEIDKEYYLFMSSIRVWIRFIDFLNKSNKESFPVYRCIEKSDLLESIDFDAVDNALSVKNNLAD